MSTRTAVSELDGRVREVFSNICTRCPRYEARFSRFECPIMYAVPGDQTTRVFTDSFFPYRLPSDSIFTGSRKRTREIEKICCRLRESIEAPGGYFNRLDNVLSEQLDCALVTVDESDTVIESAKEVLCRLPECPPQLMAIPPCLHNRAFIHTSDINPRGLALRTEKLLWEDLDAVRKLDTNLIRIALNFASPYGSYWNYLGHHRLQRGANPKEISLPLGWSSEALQAYVDFLSELWEQAARFSISCTVEDEIAWFCVKAFLATSWQRSATLLSWYHLERQLKFGLNFSESGDNILRGIPWALEDQLFLEKSFRKSPYMCPWAYQLLQRDRAVAALDLRSFHERNCTRLPWDELSYRAVSGGRAVHVDSSNANGTLLQYCQTSQQTMAISHVWSHGQGGHPERTLADGSPGGLNACLHEKYTSLAKRFGCDSYWIDSACIPEDAQLRKEAISNINAIFLQSKVVLVCDRDLMTIDITNLDVGIQESILATILVCDWNVRAWTLLEGLRGRRNIYILCKDNHTVSIQECLATVARLGHIDLAILFLTPAHLLPPRKRDPRFHYPAGLLDDWIEDGYVSVEEAATLLSHRQTSKKGDGLVIWSLLTGHNRFKDSEEMWKSTLLDDLHRKVHTGFLVSSVPRVEGVEGLSWAPRQPACDRSEPLSYLPSGNLAITDRAWLLDGNISCFWGVHTFQVNEGSSSELSKSLEAVRIMIRKVTANGIPYKTAALLQPLALHEGSIPAAVRCHGGVHGVLFAICGQVRRNRWKWIGVYNWKLEHKLPDFAVIFQVLDEIERRSQVLEKAERTYRQIVTQNLNEYFRIPESTTVAGNSFNATITDSSAPHLVQNAVSARLLEGILLFMGICAGVSFFLERSTRNLPKNPASIASAMSLFPDSDFLQIILQELSMPGGEKRLHDGILKESHFRLGWWNMGTACERFGIDIERPGESHLQIDDQKSFSFGY